MAVVAESRKRVMPLTNVHDAWEAMVDKDEASRDYSLVFNRFIVFLSPFNQTNVTRTKILGKNRVACIKKVSYCESNGNERRR